MSVWICVGVDMCCGARVVIPLGGHLTVRLMAKWERVTFEEEKNSWMRVGLRV